MERLRKTEVLKVLGIPSSSWYRRPVPADQRRRPGPAAKPIPDEVLHAVIEMAVNNPWYGYKRIAGAPTRSVGRCRREGQPVKNRQAYRVMRDHGLLQKRRPRDPELLQTAKLFELLPQKPNDLWQMDVTYIHIPGYGWWYAVTVIDYYSRYLLACHLTHSYSAQKVTAALQLARQEAERIHGPLKKPPFLLTDNGSSFIAKRFVKFVSEDYSRVRIRYRTPTQLGLLERFHRTLKTEEVYWRLYDHPQHARECLAEFRGRYNQRRPHWALVPEAGGDPLVPEEVYRHGHAIQIPRWQQWARAAQKRLEELLEVGCLMRLCHASANQSGTRLPSPLPCLSGAGGAATAERGVAARRSLSLPSKPFPSPVAPNLLRLRSTKPKQPYPSNFAPKPNHTKTTRRSRLELSAKTVGTCAASLQHENKKKQQVTFLHRQIAFD